MRLAKATGCPRPSAAKDKCRPCPGLSRLLMAAALQGAQPASTEDRVGAGNRKMGRASSLSPADQAFGERREGHQGCEGSWGGAYSPCSELLLSLPGEGVCFWSAPSPGRGSGSPAGPPPPYGQNGRQEERPGTPTTQSKMGSGCLALPLWARPGLWSWLTSCPRALMPALLNTTLAPWHLCAPNTPPVPAKGGKRLACQSASAHFVPDDLSWGQDPGV